MDDNSLKTEIEVLTVRHHCTCRFINCGCDEVLSLLRAVTILSQPELATLVEAAEKIIEARRV
jgi:hypothetical protein